MTPSFLEDHSSQLPALQLLQQLGYTFLRPTEIHLQRKGRLSNVILEDILDAQLRKLNRIRYTGKETPFSDANLAAAIRTIQDLPPELGLVPQSEWAYDLLALGKSFEETIDGDTKSFSLRYVDWENPRNNVFHVAAEFEVERAASSPSSSRSASRRRPDIVLFVNGIPFAVSECKRSDSRDPIDSAISQQLRNQQEDEIRRLFVYPQLLLSLSGNDAAYGTTATPKDFWSRWREPEEIDSTLKRLVNLPLTASQKDALFADRFHYAREAVEDRELEGEREVTEQDRALYSLCRPDRLLDLTRGFIVFDKGEKKIARYQQYFAVKQSMHRVKRRASDEARRTGGVIWHTQGSGKSLTMVMLAQALALDPDIEDPKVVVVTDRVDLDNQIRRTFAHCGKEPVQAKTGKHLLQLLRENKEAVITTVLDKFRAAVAKDEEAQDASDNIFVLVDEGHRSQHGKFKGFGKANLAMQRILPRACYLGFTGTPLMQQEKQTAELFGGLIDTYTIDQAVRDKAVVPLIYEGRHALQEVNRQAIDKWFSIVSEPLSDEQNADLKRKSSTPDQLGKVRSTIKEIAWDISEHFSKNVPAPFKGQLSAPNKFCALQYKKYLDEFGKVSSEVVISAPDTREGNENAYRRTKQEVHAFWKEMMDRFGTEAEYNKQIIQHYLEADEPQLLIVVDKLLTGFDAPRNQVLYICRGLREHTLLQAIARVNRLHHGKDFGLIIDYYGVIRELDEALDLYSTLPGFDEGDLAGTLTDIRVEAARLPQVHSELWDIFKTVGNKGDKEAYERFLADGETRERFYAKLAAYHRCLGIALSSLHFYASTPAARIETYKKDLVFFLRLRKSVKQRYAETIDYRQYEAKVQLLLDEHIETNEVIRITRPVNIFEAEQFQDELDRLGTIASKADTIAHRTKRTITERMDEDPAFYRRFSRILEEAIEAFRQKRISDSEYLEKATEVMNAVRDRTGDRVVPVLVARPGARAVHGVLMESFPDSGTGSGKEKREAFALQAALRIEDAIVANIVVDWVHNPDVENRIRNEIDDILFTDSKAAGVELDFAEADRIADQCLTIARSRYDE